MTPGKLSTCLIVWSCALQTSTRYTQCTCRSSGTCCVPGGVARRAGCCFYAAFVYPVRGSTVRINTMHVLLLSRCQVAVWAWRRAVRYCCTVQGLPVTSLRGGLRFRVSSSFSARCWEHASSCLNMVPYLLACEAFVLQGQDYGPVTSSIFMMRCICTLFGGPSSSLCVRLLFYSVLVECTVWRRCHHEKVCLSVHCSTRASTIAPRATVLQHTRTKSEEDVHKL